MVRAGTELWYPGNDGWRERMRRFEAGKFGVGSVVGAYVDSPPGS